MARRSSAAGATSCSVTARGRRRRAALRRRRRPSGRSASAHDRERPEPHGRRAQRQAQRLDLRSLPCRVAGGASHLLLRNGVGSMVDPSQEASRLLARKRCHHAPLARDSHPPIFDPAEGETRRLSHQPRSIRRQSLLSTPGPYPLSRRLATIPASPSAALRSRRAAPCPRWLPGVCQPSPVSSSASRRLRRSEYGSPSSGAPSK